MQPKGCTVPVCSIALVVNWQSIVASDSVIESTNIRSLVTRSLVVALQYTVISHHKDMQSGQANASNKTNTLPLHGSAVKYLILKSKKRYLSEFDVIRPSGGDELRGATEHLDGESY